jgi:hypothetical protein
MGNDLRTMDSWKGIHDGVEKIEMNLRVEAEFAGDEKRRQKSSQAVRDELRRRMEGTTSGGLR